MKILENDTPNELVFELVNVDTSFANALRRILLAEVPTVALEHIYIYNNSSLIHDEVLSHRMGLVPLMIDARRLDEVDEDDDSPTDRNTVVFKLKVACASKATVAAANKSRDNFNDSEDDDDEVVQSNADLEEVAAEAANVTDQNKPRKLQFPKDRPYTKHVYSKDLMWVPQGDQKDRFEDIRPVHDDILIAKLRPGQEIDLEAHGRRGIGKDHSKYSPVATASYRLMPLIELVEPVYDELADELVHVYEPGVFELVPTDSRDPAGVSRKAKVCNPYACTMSRNYMRHPELEKAVSMSRVPDHFIFSVESVGMYKPAVLVAEALRILQRKCQRVMDLVDESVAKTSA
jgi:DNA-directed RNA polymerase I and III subunit RPAC1